jgi:DNA-binding transcriptional ArsR family regulator
MNVQQQGDNGSLDRLAAFYAEERLAIVWTVANTGDDAKRVVTTGWQHAQPLPDADFALAMFRGRIERANPAVVLRASNLVGLECDSEDDLATIEALGLPLTVTVQSSQPYKRHYWFRPPAELETIPVVAFRFESDRVTEDVGRYFLIPPAMHPSGMPYRFLHDPADVDIAELPVQTYKELRKAAAQTEKEERQELEHNPEAKIRAGKRRESIFRYACMQRRWSASRDLILNACLEYNRAHCEPLLSDQQVEAQVDGAMKMDGEQELAAVAATVYDGTRFTLDDVVTTFRKWLHLPDPAPVLLTLAAVVANEMAEGDPVWLVIVGGSSRGKTEILIALDGVAGVRITGALTVAALLSGTARKERTKGATGGLLRELGDQGILVVKDLGAILTLHREARAQVLQALRDIFDGRYTRDVGVDGGTKLEWSGRVGLVGGATSALDQAHAVLAALGERWVTVRLPEGGDEPMTRFALRGADTAAMRDELRDVVHGFLGSLEPVTLRPLSEDEEDLIVALAPLICLARSPVDRDPYKRDIVLVHQPEGPARIARQLHKLFVALETFGVDPTAVIVKAGLDSIPSPRRETLLHLLRRGEESTSKIAIALELPRTTAERTLEELTAHGLTARRKSGDSDTSVNLWAPTDEATQRWSTITAKCPDAA